MNAILREKIKDFCKEAFAEKLRDTLSKGHELDEFNLNPFLSTALASGVFGELTPSNMAKVLLYPRVLGTSISTTFGDRMQKMCVEHLGARASGVAGMDIEFGDKVEPQEVVAQLKAGPNTLNAGDVKEIVQEMGSAFRLLRQNKVSNMPTFAMCITYGEAAEVSTQYKNIKNAGVGAQAEIPLYVGQDFWYRLTGDKSFYHELIAVFVELFEEEDFSKLLKADIQRLSKEIEERYFTNGIFDLEKV